MRQTGTLLMFVVFTLVLAPLAQAKPRGNGRSMATQVKRYSRYFNRAHTAVTSGRVRPHAKLTSVGIHGAFLVGGAASVGRARVIHKGMEHKFTVYRATGSFGADVGAGPRVSVQRYFAKPGARVNEVIPTTESGSAGSFGIGSGKGSVGNKGQKSTGWDLSPIRFGAYGTGSVSKVVKSRKPPRKSAMLKHLEEGKSEARKASSALSAGNTVKAQQHLDRAVYLRSLISNEKRQLNTYRTQANAN